MLDQVVCNKKLKLWEMFINCYAHNIYQFTNAL